VAGQSQPNHPAGGSFDTRILLGMGEAPASAKVRREGCVVRVIARDGQGFPVTADYRRNRVNLTIEHGHVTSVGVY
jgi:hypothetical protein